MKRITMAIGTEKDLDHLVFHWLHEFHANIFNFKLCSQFAILHTKMWKIKI